MDSTPSPHILICFSFPFFFFLTLSLAIPFLASAASISNSLVLPKESLPTKSGYLPLTSSSKSAIFYAFYEAQQPKTPLSQTPLLIWLQGGPGCSSFVGNFYELGPWRVNSLRHNVGQLVLERNPAPWNRLFGLVFMDNPIGVGFSIAASREDIPKDQHKVAEHLFAAITRLVKQEPGFKYRPIYVTGESYAGKYVPSIGYYILKKNEGLPASQRVNLAGVAIGNGLTDPIIQVGTHAVNAYYSGFINEMQKHELERAQDEAVRLTRMGNWSEATDARSGVLRMLQDMTGLATLYDYTREVPYNTQWVTELLRSKEVKKALGANESIVFEECSDLVGEVLHDDVMKSVKYMVEYLVKNTKVLLYQGFNDLRDGAVSTEAWVKTMKWEGIERFMSADRKVWRVNRVVAGYVQKWGSLSHVVVSGAGHLVPADRPLSSQAMIEGWILEKGSFANVRKKGSANNDHFEI